MSPLLPSKPFTMAVAVGGVPTSQYGTSPYNNFEGSSVQQDGLQPVSVDGGGQLQVGGNWQKPTGGTVPATAVLVGGYYAGGPRFLPLNLDSSGNIIVSSIVGSPTVTQGTQGTAAEGWFVELTDGTNVLGTSGHPLYVQDAILEASVALSGASITGLKYQAVAGSDGTFLRPMLTSSTGQLHTIIDSSASIAVTGTFYQATQPISGTVTAVGDAANGSAVAGNPVLVAGSDGTDARTLATDSSGRQGVVGAAGSGSAVAGNPVLMGGSDGTDARTLLTDNTGQLKVLVENTSLAVTGTFYQATQPVSGTVTAVGDAASGSAVAGNPVLIAGSDGTDARTLLTDTSGQLKVLVENASVAVTGAFYQATQPVSLASAVTVVGDAANGSAVAGNPVLVAGSDGTDARSLLASSTGQLHVIVDSGGGSNASVGATGSATPADATLIGASNGTDLEPLLVDGSGYLKVNVAAGSSGNAAASATGSAVPADADYIGGNKGGTLTGLLIDSNGQLEVTSKIKDGNNNIIGSNNQGGTGNYALAVSLYDSAGAEILALNNSLGVALADGNGTGINSVDFSSSTYIPYAQAGQALMVYVMGEQNTGLGAVATAAPSYAQLMAGTDGYASRALQTDDAGHLRVVVVDNSVVDYLDNLDHPLPVAVDNAPALNGYGVLRVQEDNAFLLQSAPAAQSTTVLTQSAVSTVTGNCVAVSVTSLAAAATQFGGNLCVRIRLANGMVGPWQSCGLLFGGQSATLYFNLPVMAGSTVAIDTVSPATLNASFALYAAVMPEAVAPLLRSDGRSLPQFSLQAAGTQVGNGTSTLVSNTNSALRILVASAQASTYAAAAGGACAVNGVVDGASANLTNVPSGVVAPGPIIVPPQGILIDPGQSVTMQVSGGVAADVLCNLFYDIVPA